jgi:hypothetical protein
LAITPERRLIGYRHTGEGFAVMSPDERGWLWREPVRAWIGIVENEVCCFVEAGKMLGSYPQEVVARRAAEGRAAVAEERATEAEERTAQAEAHAAAEVTAREAAEARLATLEAKLQRWRGA